MKNLYPTEAVVIEKLTKVFNDRLKTVIALENLDLSSKKVNFCVLLAHGVERQRYSEF